MKYLSYLLFYAIYLYMDTRLKNARAISIYILYEVLIKNHSRDQIIERILDSYKSISRQDFSLIFNIVMNCLRYKDAFDKIIETTLKKRTDRIENKILISIEIALAQMLCMDKIPAYAIVNETINGFKEIENNKNKKNFLNYALRNIIKNNNLLELFYNFKHKNDIKDKFISALRDEMSIDEIESIYNSSYVRPINSIRINSSKTDVETTIKILSRNNIKCHRSEISHDCIIFDDDISILRLKDIILEDHFVLQSELSQLAIDILNPQKGEKILDACSGNQIKASHIHERTYGQIDITSIDTREVKNPKYKFIRGDATKIQLNKSFDKILIDAPCSGLGTLPNNPEIKYKIKGSAILRYSAIQLNILKNISRYLKKGGVILYTVCTITKSETEKVIKNFVEENSEFEIIRPVLNNMKLNEYITKDNFIRIINYNHNSFFYALLQRK